MMDGELTVGILPSAARTCIKGEPSFGTLVTELELYDYLFKAPNVETFNKRVNGLLQSINIHSWSHVCINMVVEVLDAFGAYPGTMLEQYRKEEFHRDDLINRHMLVSDQPLFEHRVYKYLESAPFTCGLISRNLQMYNLLKKHGLQNIFSMPIIAPGYRAVFTVSAAKDDPVTFEATVLRNLNFLLTLAKIVDTVGRTKFEQYFHGAKVNAAIPINLKPLQLLTVLATKDLTLNEAAEVLGISISTANQHIAAAKKAFGTNTTHGTMIAALQNGFITLDD